MAVSAFNLLTTGSAINWTPSGGTYALTLTSLATAAARGGAKGDLGTYWRRRWAVLFATAVGTAATAGNLVNLGWAGSPTATAGTDNPGGWTGTDASFGTPAELFFQLQFVGGLYLSNAAGTGVQVQMFELFPRYRYGGPVVYNLSGQTLSSTAANHEVRLVPIDDVQASTNAG